MPAVPGTVEVSLLLMVLFNLKRTLNDDERKERRAPASVSFDTHIQYAPVDNKTTKILPANSSSLLASRGPVS